MRKATEFIHRLGQIGEITYLDGQDDGGSVAVRLSSGDEIRIIFSWGLKWDHVSVSFADRCPTWNEMEMVKRVFFKDRETAMQLHVPPSDHISFHPFCLHLWRPQHEKIPRPPAMMVGPRNARILEIRN